MNSNKQEKSGAIISYATIFFSIVTGLLYTPFLINKLGLTDYGIYTLSASVIASFTIDFGMGAALTRFIARYRAENREHKVKDLLGVTTKLYIAVDIILIIVLFSVYVFSPTIFSNLSEIELEKFRGVFLVSIFFVLFNFPLLPVDGVFIAFEKIVPLKVFNFISKFISVSLLFATLILGYGLFGVVIVQAAVTLLFQIIKVFYLYKKVNLRINFKSKDKQILKSIGSFSAWATVGMLADKFFFPIIPTLLAIFSNTEHVAFFAIVISIEGYILTISKALNGIFIPRVMRLVVNNSPVQEQTSLMIKVGRIQLYIIGLFIIFLICFGRIFFKFWLGDGFDISYFAMIIVLIPCLFHLTQTIAEELVYAQNKVKYRAFINIATSILSVTIISILSSKFGAIGAAIGVAVGFIVGYGIIANVIYAKKLNIDIIRFFKECHGKLAIPLIISLFFGFLFQNLIDAESFVSFIIFGLLWVVVYVLVMWVFALNKEEKILISSPLRRILGE